MSAAGHQPRGFLFGSQTIARTPTELLNQCARSPERGAELLGSGEIERWLSLIGRSDLARVAAESRRAGADPVQSLHLFIEFSRIRQYFNRARERRLSVVLVGRTGVGKSSIINTLSGCSMAPTGAAEPVTADVRTYSVRINGIQARFVDTPGLCDGMDLDDDYIDRIRAEVGKTGVDCIWFLTPLPETRVRTDEIKALETVTRAFGPQVWQRSIVLLTFTDYLSDPERYLARLEQRPPPIRAAIADAIEAAGPARGPAAAAVAQDVLFVPLTNDAEVNPDGRRWLGSILFAMLRRMAPEGTAPFRGNSQAQGETGLRSRCYPRDGTGRPPPYQFICRSLGQSGQCGFCLSRFERIPPGPD